MELRIFTEPQQGATYDDLLTIARHSEQLGFGAFFRSDHYEKMGDVSGLPGPSDAWITLAGLARDTKTIRLGTLVTAATFRLPGPLAISVANVDAMSNGRIELGLGTGWFDTEHASYGIPFPSLRERFDRLEEQLMVLTGLWQCPASEPFDFRGRHYTLTASPALPKPIQAPHPPIIIGGAGQKRTPNLAARFANEFNVPFHSVADTANACTRVRDACHLIGRDPDSLVYSAAQVVCIGENETQIRARAQSIGRDAQELRANGVAGTPDEALAKIEQFANIGVTRLYLQVLDLQDLAHLDCIASQVMNHL